MTIPVDVALLKKQRMVLIRRVNKTDKTKAEYGYLLGLVELLDDVYDALKDEGEAVVTKW